MAHSILSMHQQYFDSRVTLGGCLINIDGETVDCRVEKDGRQVTTPTYTVRSKDTAEELCSFRPYHLDGGPSCYQVEGASRSGAEATLIVPSHGLLERENEEDHSLAYAD